MYNKAFLIYNPFAGQLTGKGKRRLWRALETLSRAGHTVQAIPTTGPGTATAIAADCVSAGADLILAAGGDGTINEVVNGMIHSSVPLAILPGGTANVLAVELGLGKTMETAAGLVGGSVAERVAAGLIRNEMHPEGRYFLLMAGAGLDADIVYHMNAGWKSALGKVAYWLGGFGQLGRSLPEFEIVVNGKTLKVSFALASRVRNYGGDIEIARTVSLLDDRFELVLFEGRSAFAYLKYLVGIALRRLDRTEGVNILHGTEALLERGENERIYVQVDGEFAGWLPAAIEIVPDAITLLTPPGFRARTRSGTVGRPKEWTHSHTR